MRLEQIVTALKITKQTSFSGLVGSSAAAILASLTNDYPSMLVITPSTERAEALKAEIQLFSGKKVLLFPAPDTLPDEEIQPSKEITGERLAILDKWRKGEQLVVVASVKAVMGRTSRRLEVVRLSGNQGIRIDMLIAQLINLGYQRFDIVGEKGEFSVRGGIVDVFPLNLDNPIRLEFVDDKIASIRIFNAYSQRSMEKLCQVAVLPSREAAEVPVFDHLPKGTVVVYDELLEIERAAGRSIEVSAEFATIKLSQFLRPEEEALFSSPPSYLNKLAAIPPQAIVVSKHAARLREEISAEIVEGSLRGGFAVGGVQVLSDRELFGEALVQRRKQPLAREGVADELLADLITGDYVVHETYGIGIFRGMTTLDIDGFNQEYLLIEFAGEDRVYVPPSMAGLVEKYSSGGELTPKLSRLGTKQWLRTRSKVKKRLKDMTKELLQLYAARQKLPGYAFMPDDVWQQELEGTFSFGETPDQRRAIAETKRDMERTIPMDRLICGDVGYGKTEVAIRAAAKAVSAGKQVAILVPTTILAEQHYNNFRERFQSSPFVIEMLSRFKSKKEQAGIVRALAGGGVDIVIGTHRLLQRDIKFKDLGLLIVDEEQRFGVAHKEKLKSFKQTVDVLTLSATPIPRTLYLSLSGARDMSVINTPPVDRSPIRTYVIAWSEAVIKEAILRELDRGGQVFYLHNFVETIEGAAAKVKRLVPGAKVVAAHGRLPEKDLEQTMMAFLDRKYNVLVCTSIIESGLDIPNVNTILIDQADRFGLSQLYQIRGRVGRSAVRAYAYLFYHPEKVLTDLALERLKAIQEFTALGSGYKLAMRDLEIRGAGNLLGAEQSGHVMEVGFDLYCELLEESVRELKGIKEATPRQVEIDLKVEAYLPGDYITDDRQRLAIYRRMNLLSARQEISELKRELSDRYGPLPPAGRKLLAILDLRVRAIAAGIISLKEDAGWLIIESRAGQRRKIEIKGQDKLKFAELNIRG